MVGPDLQYSWKPIVQFRRRAAQVCRLCGRDLSGGGFFGTFSLVSPATTKARNFLASLLRFGTILVTTAFGGLCLWAIATRVFYNPADNAFNYVCFAPAIVFGVLLLVNFLFTGLASWVSEDQDREWWARSAAWILITIFAWIVVNVLVLWGAQALTTQTDNRLAFSSVKCRRIPWPRRSLVLSAGVTGLIAAFLALRSKFTKAFGSGRGSQGILVLVAIVFFVLLSLVISWILLFFGSQPWAIKRAACCWARARLIRVSSSSSSSSPPPTCFSGS